MHKTELEDAEKERIWSMVHAGEAEIKKQQEEITQLQEQLT